MSPAAKGVVEEGLGDLDYRAEEGEAWKKRWFVLRSGRLTGDPDVLEYYKNDHAKKPIRVIDLNLCEQVDAGLTFNKKDLEHSFIFDIKTIERVFYLVADTEEEMNKWVRCICDICGFNPTDDDSAKPSHPPSSTVVDVPPHPAHAPVALPPLGGVPPPYQPVSVHHLESSSSQEEPQDYLWLVNCESKKPESRPQFESSKSVSSDTDCNDNVPPHRTPTFSSSKHASVNGFFSQPSSIYDSPPPRAASLSMDTGLYFLPRSYSQDTVLLPKSSSPPPVPEADSSTEPCASSLSSRQPPVEARLRQVSLSYDFPPAPGSSCTYQVPRTVGSEGVPPPRPPKPSPAALPERSPTDTYAVPRSVSEADNYGSQDFYDIPRSYPSDRSSLFDFNESFNNYFKNKGIVPVSSTSMEEIDENYVPMSANSPPHHHSGSLAEPPQEPNYVPMTPSTSEFSSLGKQVPPPAHMGFRSSPKTPPRRPMLISDCQPPPVDRNLKPDRKAKPAPLTIKPLTEWEELPAPVRSPVTRTFAREFPMPSRPVSVHSNTSSTDSEEPDENYVAMHNSSMSSDEPNVKHSAQMNTDGGGSPMVKPKGDKQVEYLDLDLDPGKSTPPRKKKSNGTGSTMSDERVDYVVVDQQRTQALKNTREAWNDGRQSTETDTLSKGPKARVTPGVSASYVLLFGHTQCLQVLRSTFFRPSIHHVKISRTETLPSETRGPFEEQNPRDCAHHLAHDLSETEAGK
ncbi:GRB2-associated-binding protein 1-like [Scleropages formosus]|uniref:GRB2-associated-binding protein 1-like n=1 Tax=Scleropages formosus TaxID=113540 RepID=A0A0P7YNR4_SCLFO|nr:GRB2-associated-binding protein 1-like [Scleropages formosus]